MRGRMAEELHHVATGYNLDPQRDRTAMLGRRCLTRVTCDLSGRWHYWTDFAGIPGQHVTMTLDEALAGIRRLVEVALPDEPVQPRKTWTIMHLANRRSD